MQSTLLGSDADDVTVHVEAHFLLLDPRNVSLELVRVLGLPPVEYVSRASLSLLLSLSTVNFSSFDFFGNTKFFWFFFLFFLCQKFFFGKKLRETKRGERKIPVK